VSGITRRSSSDGGGSQGGGPWIDQRGALRRNCRVSDEGVNSVRDDIVWDHTRFDEVIHRSIKVSLEVALKTGEGRSTSPGGSNMLDMVQARRRRNLYRCLSDGVSWF
jgi:hypothetical protein